ncbi:response regulator transcription factor [Lysinibacillus piscis]|uniref:Response regulatory domain-containing protein n=1 Tax=Lysinibacillus piscis TaxID=2518931 RepID=A0ABQ5NFQ8_9BACI|nr:response regulator [Lysinibacillus sp. KH24]GLC87225.1 hypothetical protein LYSBPC_03520 [Lysinibacillus sp. KH24]
MTRILIVDDEEILRMLIYDTLEGLGYEVDEAADGQEALEKVVEHTYDLMILDYMMPNLTGIEVLEQLPAHIHFPILMLSAKSQEEDRQFVLQKGAHYFMAKPFSPSELLQIVEEILHA